MTLVLWAMAYLEHELQLVGLARGSKSEIVTARSA